MNDGRYGQEKKQLKQTKQMTAHADSRPNLIRSNRGPLRHAALASTVPPLKGCMHAVHFREEEKIGSGSTWTEKISTSTCRLVGSMCLIK
jgi:hypothetical protein